MKSFTYIAGLLLLTAMGCNRGGIPDDYTRIVVRNGSDTEAVTFDVTNADGEVVLSELLEPKSSANARSAPGTHVATATVPGAEGEDGTSYSEAFEAGIVAYVTYNSADEENEAGLSVVAPNRNRDDDSEDGDGEENGDGDNDAADGGGDDSE